MSLNLTIGFTIIMLSMFLWVFVCVLFILSTKSWPASRHDEHVYHTYNTVHFWTSARNPLGGTVQSTLS